MIEEFNFNDSELTQPLFIFPEEEEMFERMSIVFEEPKRKKSFGKSNFKVFNTQQKLEISSEDEEELKVDAHKNEIQKVEDVEKIFPTNYGYFPYYSGTTRLKAKNETMIHDGNYHYFDNYQLKKKNDNPKDYSEYYNNKYGIKIRKMDVKELNNQIKNNTKINDQYWNNKKPDTNGEYQDPKVFDYFQQDKTIKLDNDHVDSNNVQKVFISGIINQISTIEKNEEDNNIIKKPQKQNQKQEIINSVITSFVGKNVSNKIDDLNQLLKKSQKYKEAKLKITGNSKYQDLDFPSNEYSIYGFGERKDYSLDELVNLPWQSPEVFIKEGPILVYDSIQSNDIFQGGLGDCYFLAALSAIAEYPERLERLFLIKEYNKEGIYVVALCINGIWQDVVLDDKFPCTKYSKEPAFNRSKSGELWVMLLEKAWAKVHGGYMNIAAGLTREALRDLTGACAKTFFTSQNREELWKQLLEANDKEFIMTAGSDDLNSGSDSYIEKIGIAGSHAYSLLEVNELVVLGPNKYRVFQEGEVSNNTERIVKLRNPWGHGEWKGDWSDLSPKWTPELKIALNFEDNEDGVFYMTYNDFVKYFSDCQICYYHNDYKYSAIQIESGFNESVGLKFKIYTHGLFYFSLNQKNKRFFPKTKDYCYSNCNFILARIKENGQPDFIGANLKADKENWIEYDCQPGEYIVLIKSPWKSFVNQYSFSIYGPCVMDFEKFDPKILSKSFLKELCISHAVQDQTEPMYDFGSQGYPNIKYKTFDNKGGIGYIYFENNSDKIEAEIVVELLGSINIQLNEPFSGLRPSLTVKPKQVEIITYEGTKLPYSSQMRLLSSFKDSSKKESIRDQVIQSTTILTKSMKGKKVDIKVFVLYHSNGLAMLYQNNTDEYTITEELEFNLVDCHIDGSYGNFIEVVVLPKNERLIQIIKNSEATSFEANITKLFYSIK